MQHWENGTEVREKGTNDLVTNADLESERTITEFIRTASPAAQFLAEEEHQATGDALAGDELWVIDPLDGTTNFAHGVPHFAVSIGCYRNGQPECGVVFNPVRDELYFASSGNGAYFQLQQQPVKQLQVGSQQVLSEVLIGVGFYYERGAMMQATLATIESLFRQQIRGIRRFGTASLDLCQVARGMYGAFFEYTLSPWDFAAGRIIVEEAGGRVTSATGHTLPLEKSSVLASNTHLHQTMLDQIATTTGQIF